MKWLHLFVYSLSIENNQSIVVLNVSISWLLKLLSIDQLIIKIIDFFVNNL